MAVFIPCFLFTPKDKSLSSKLVLWVLPDTSHTCLSLWICLAICTLGWISSQLPALPCSLSLGTVRLHLNWLPCCILGSHFPFVIGFYWHVSWLNNAQCNSNKLWNFKGRKKARYSHSEGIRGSWDSPQVSRLHFMDTIGSRKWVARWKAAQVWTDKEKGRKERDWKERAEEKKERERHTTFKQKQKECVT